MALSSMQRVLFYGTVAVRLVSTILTRYPDSNLVTPPMLSRKRSYATNGNVSVKTKNVCIPTFVAQSGFQEVVVERKLLDASRQIKFLSRMNATLVPVLADLHHEWPLLVPLCIRVSMHLHMKYILAVKRDFALRNTMRNVSHLST